MQPYRVYAVSATRSKSSPGGIALCLAAVRSFVCTMTMESRSIVPVVTSAGMDWPSHCSKRQCTHTSISDNSFESLWLFSTLEGYSISLTIDDRIVHNLYTITQASFPHDLMRKIKHLEAWVSGKSTDSRNSCVIISNSIRGSFDARVCDKAQHLRVILLGLLPPGSPVGSSTPGPLRTIAHIIDPLLRFAGSNCGMLENLQTVEVWRASDFCW